MNRHSQRTTTHSLPGPDDITRAQLPNGILVLSRANFHSPSVFISGLLPAGALFDSDNQLGLADFTATALMRGSDQRDFQGIYETLESIGASLGIGCGAHSASFIGKALVEDLDTLLTLLAEVLLQPTFPAEQVERLRAQLLTALAVRDQNTDDLAALAFDRIVYEDHPYSRPEDGFPETVGALKRADLVAFHRKHYGPRGMLIAVVGSVDPALAVEKVARALGEWQNPEQISPPALPPLKPLTGAITQRVTIPGKSQADLVIGAPGPPRASADFLAAALGNSILGQFGMMGRIGEAVRQKAGLAYHVSSSLSGGPGPGPWDVVAGVDPENVNQAIDMILREIRRFVSESVSQEELDDSQASYVGRLPISLESNAGVAASLLHLERYGLGLDYYRRYADLVRSVTTEEVLEAARRYLHPDRLGIAVAGPG